MELNRRPSGEANRAVHKAQAEIARAQDFGESQSSEDASVQDKSNTAGDFSREKYGLDQNGGLGHDFNFGVRNFGPEDNVSREDDEYWHF